MSGRKWHADKMPIKNLEDDITQLHHHRFLFCFPVTPHPTCSICQCVIALLQCRSTTTVPLLLPSHSPSHLQHLPVRDCTFAMQAAVNHALSTSTSRGSGGCVVYLCLSLPCSGICGSSCCCTDALRPSRSHRVADL